MKNLKIAYFTAFALIALLSTLKLVTVLFITHQEDVTQQYITLLSDQAIHSQRLQRNAILLLVPGDHRITIQNLQYDLNALEANHKTFQSYASFTSQLTAISVKTKPAYIMMIAAAHALVTLEHNTRLTQKARQKAEIPYITQIFYSEDIHLTGIQQSFVIVNAQSDAYVTQVQLLFWINYVLTLLVLCIEAWFVLRPALRSFHRLESEKKEV